MCTSVYYIATYKSCRCICFFSSFNRHYNYNYTTYYVHHTCTSMSCILTGSEFMCIILIFKTMFATEHADMRNIHTCTDIQIYTCIYYIHCDCCDSTSCHYTEPSYPKSDLTVSVTKLVHKYHEYVPVVCGMIINFDIWYRSTKSRKVPSYVINMINVHTYTWYITNQSAMHESYLVTPTSWTYSNDHDIYVHKFENVNLLTFN